MGKEESEIQNGFQNNDFWPLSSISFKLSLGTHVSFFKWQEDLLLGVLWLNWSSYQLPPYKFRLSLFDMIFLGSRWDLASAIFVFDLLGGNIKCPHLCNRIQLNLNVRNLRHVRMLKERLFSTNYFSNEPFNRNAVNFKKCSK